MNFNKLTGTIVFLMLSSAAAHAADAHHDQHAPAPATDSHAADAKDAPASNAAGKDAASQSADEPGKPVPVKKARKSARAKPQHKAPTHGTQADAHGGKDASASDAHAPQSTSPAQANAGANEGHGSKRLRVKNRNNAAAASANATDAHATSSSAPADSAGHDAHAAPAASAAHDDHQAPAAADNHAAPPAKAGHDDHAAPAAKQVPPAKDAHGSKDSHAAPAASHHDAHAAPASHAVADPHADSHAAPAKSTTAEAASDYCNPPLKSEVAALFDRWNASLRTGDPKKVVANYAPGSVLLPTVSNRARFTTAEKEDYFVHFLARRPEGSIDDRVIDVDCNSATDAGLYTFRFSDGTMVKARYSFSYRKIGSQWLITSHHSSAMPEKPEVTAEHAPAVAPAPKPAERAEQGSPAKGWVRYP